MACDHAGDNANNDDGGDGDDAGKEAEYDEDDDGPDGHEEAEEDADDGHHQQQHHHCYHHHCHHDQATSILCTSCSVSRFLPARTTAWLTA